MIESLVGLNPDVEKKIFLIEQDQEVVFNDHNIRQSFRSNFSYAEFDYDKTESIKACVLEFLQRRIYDIRISSKVLRNSFKLIDSLHPSMLEFLNQNSIYFSENGTVIIDWEKDINNVLSLEIGADYLGYFIEKDGVDIKQVDNAEIDTWNRGLIDDISKFLA